MTRAVHPTPTRLHTTHAGTRTMNPRTLLANRIRIRIRMRIRIPIRIGAGILAAISVNTGLLGHATGQTLAEPAQRISDPVIHADYASYTAQQKRIQALNDSARHRVASYSLSKAQCWLDVSFHEYSRNDRSPFPQAALTESFRITDYLARGGDPASPSNPAAQTPLVNNAERLRPDLWTLAEQLKQQAGYRCAEQRLACAEVELVHAGNEIKQQGWRHAKPYVQIAEDQFWEAQAAANACNPPPTASLAAPPPPTQTAPIAPVPVIREANVLFNFDKRDIPNVRVMTLERLDRLLAELMAGTMTAQRITVTGHADISNFTGDNQYNVRLARDRAEIIRTYMAAKGIPFGLITVDSKSDTQQVAPCERKRGSQAEYQECLLPNRRVEVVVEAVRAAR